MPQSSANNIKSSFSSRNDGIHLAIDFSQGSALTWVAGELAVALADIGQRVSIPRTNLLSPTLEKRLLPRLSALMTDRPYRTYQIKLNHYWPQFLMQEVTGEINAELFVTNYRFRGDIRPLDMWSRNLVTNGVRKLPMSSFCRDSLKDLGVPSAQCAVVSPGYSPEIEALFPVGKPPNDAAIRKLLVVTNSHDLYRYGTDILIAALAKAYGPNDPVEIHIKDYGATSGSRQLRELITAQPTFPKVIWHETFLSKEDLIRIYAEMHLMVSPFRGEGYAMKIIDAMAVGLPVMMPPFGGPMEYAPAGGFLPLQYDEVPVGKCYDTENYLVGPGAYWCQVREDSLIQSLRSYLANPEVSKDAARIAREHVFGRYTWRNAALSLVQNLHQWHAELDAKCSRRQRKVTLPFSVIMPTKNRPVELRKTLAGYADQEDQSFELIIINDHGDGKVVRELVSSFGKALRVRIFENDGPPGPGAARNIGLEKAEGNIFLITGDDIIPAPDLIARHRDAHRNYPASEAAFVGKVDWHKEMNRDWFTDHIVSMGGQQFDYRSLCDQGEVPFDRLYTSNVSWKRELTSDMEQIFSEKFRYAAYEDVELGYRLSQRGLKLRYLEGAVGYHLHSMTVRSFLERMRLVGNMRTVLSAMHPNLTGSAGQIFYQELEVERRRRIKNNSCNDIIFWEKTLEPLIKSFEYLDKWTKPDNLETGEVTKKINEIEWKVLAFRRNLFDYLCETFQQVGQAQEWARDSTELDWAPSWIALMRLAQRHANEPKESTQGKNNIIPISFIKKALSWISYTKR